MSDQNKDNNIPVKDSCLEIKLNDEDVIYVLVKDMREVRTVYGPGIFYLDTNHEELIEKHIPDYFDGYMEKFKGKRKDIPVGFNIHIPENYMINVIDTRNGNKKIYRGPCNHPLEYYEIPSLMNRDSDFESTIFLKIKDNRFSIHTTTQTKDMIVVEFDFEFSFNFVDSYCFNHTDYILYICNALQEKINRYFSKTMLHEMIKNSTERMVTLENGAYCYNFQMSNFQVVEMLLTKRQYKKMIRKERMHNLCEKIKEVLDDIIY